MVCRNTYRLVMLPSCADATPTPRPTTAPVTAAAMATVRTVRLRRYMMSLLGRSGYSLTPLGSQGSWGADVVRSGEATVEGSRPSRRQPGGAVSTRYAGRP